MGEPPEVDAGALGHWQIRSRKLSLPQEIRGSQMALTLAPLPYSAGVGGSLLSVCRSLLGCLNLGFVVWCWVSNPGLCSTLELNCNLWVLFYFFILQRFIFKNFNTVGEEWLQKVVSRLYS